MKKFILITFLTASLFWLSDPISTYGEVYTSPEQVKVQPDPEIIEYSNAISGTINNSSLTPDNDSTNEVSPQFSLPHFEHSGGGTLSKPRLVDTATASVKGVPLEFTIIDGNLVILQNLGYHYYTQSSTQGWFNAATARIANAGTSFLKARLTYSASTKLPLVKKVYHTKTGALLKEYNIFTNAALAMVLYDTPILGPIIYAPLPNVGTKENIIYISKTGKDYSWHYRFNIKVKKNGSYEVTPWYVQ